VSRVHRAWGECGGDRLRGAARAWQWRRGGVAHRREGGYGGAASGCGLDTMARSNDGRWHDHYILLISYG
jgi:hypothetical protein